MVSAYNSTSATLQWRPFYHSLILVNVCWLAAVSHKSASTIVHTATSRNTDQTCYLIWSLHNDTRPNGPCIDVTTLGTWQASHQRMACWGRNLKCRHFKLHLINRNTIKQQQHRCKFSTCESCSWKLLDSNSNGAMFCHNISATSVPIQPYQLPQYSYKKLFPM